MKKMGYLSGFHVCAFERSRFALLENGIGYYAITCSLKILKFEDGEFR